MGPSSGWRAWALLLAVLLGTVGSSLARSLTAGLESPVGCGEVTTSRWIRRLCFGEVKRTGKTMEDGVPASPLKKTIIEVTVNLTVTKRSPGTTKDLPDYWDWSKSCGDTLRVKFLSRRALFGVIPEEKACGVHSLTFWLPREASSYSPMVRLVHIDGEGMKDPPFPRPFPAQLFQFKSDGPEVWNHRVHFAGELHAPEGYAETAEEVESSWAWASAEDAYTGSPSERYSKNIPAEVWGKPTLPLCKGGDNPGRWVTHQSLYPDVVGEPLQWRPYGCHYSRYTGEAARYCFEEALERTKFVGESTLGQLLEHILLYMNRSHNEWPLYIDDPFVRPRHATRAMQGAGEDVDDEALLRGQHSHWSGEFHGMPLVQESALRQLRAYKPRALVMLQGANDAARDSISVFEGRLRTYLGDLKGNVTAGLIPIERFVWITAPSRQYKHSHGPGETFCPDGNSSLCVGAMGGMRSVDGRPEWEAHESVEMPLFWGTLGRRRRLNRIARELVPLFFPEAEFVDFEALTEGLPSDYSLDGEHWGCPWVFWQNRHMSPYHCRSLANVVVANVLMNTLCNKRMAEIGPIDISSTYRVREKVRPRNMEEPPTT